MTQGIGQQSLHADMNAGRHSLVSGLSPKLGGLDEGPDPHALLEASLVACTILTLQLYANHKQWDLGSITVDAHIESETKEGTRLLRTIRFGKELPSKQVERLTEIANKCPIHNLLVGKVDITTSVLLDARK
ncbi:MAG: OsmC family protein [Chitinophagaceae bacterium]|nr:OsmC family protein [Oligoflexus sp.]